MQQKRQRPPAIFSIFAPSDIQYLERWEVHLRPLVQAGTVSIWSARHLLPGTDREILLRDHLDQADLIVLLLSADFFIDGECEALMEHALERYQQGTVQVIPLLLRPFAFRETKLATFTPFPSDGRPVVLWENTEAALDDCVRGLRRILGRPVTKPLAPRKKRASIEKQNRERMLQRLRRTYEELFSQSLQGVTRIELGLADKPDAVQNAATLLFQTSTRASRLLPPDTSILDVYDEATHELLILGAPGAGKSTLLVELAQQLVGRADTNETHPLPVMLPLSSWATKRSPLHIWLAKQVAQFYDIPNEITQRWINEGQLLPLLDGLDEMEEVARPACIAAINAYHRDNLRLPLVICSRQAEYEMAAETQRISLQNAVVVQPLTREQIEQYLAQVGKPLSALRRVLATDSALAEIATTPLMVHILILTYQGAKVGRFSTQNVQLQQQIWNDYLIRMVERKGDAKRPPLEQVCAQLSWLARQMREHNQSVFYLEHLQANWLAPMQQSNYAWLAVRMPALLIGILTSLMINLLLDGYIDLASLLQYGVLGGLLGWLFSGPTSARGASPLQTKVHHRQERMHLLGRNLLLSIIVGLITGLSFGLGLGHYGYGLGDWLRDGSIYGVVIGLVSLLLSWLLPPRPSEHATIPEVNRTAQRWKKLIRLIQTIHGQRALLVIAILGVGYGLIYGLSIDLNIGLRIGEGLGYGLSNGLSLGLTCLLISLILEAQAKDISLTERLRWTWNSLIRGLFTPKHVRSAFLIAGAIGVMSGLSGGLLGVGMGSLNAGQDNWLSVGLLTTLSLGLFTTLSYGLLYWILLGLIRGISSEQIEDDARRVPNEGTRRSLRNSILMALISGGIIGVIGGLSAWLLNGLTTGLYMETGTSGLLHALSDGLSAALDQPYLGLVCLVGVSGGLLVGTVMGGLAALRHGIIRLLLRRARAIPRHYVRFLDEAVGCILLQKVGGGYRFVHRLLMDHLANLSAGPASTSTPHSPASSNSPPANTPSA